MKKRLEGLLQHALENALKGGALKTQSLPPLLFEVPRDPQLGDLASTVALSLAREERRPPRTIAETIIAHIEDPDGLLAGVEVAGPGYINFRFSPRFWRDCLVEVEKPGYGTSETGRGRRVLVEFVSTNPTGPLHVGHGRGAVIGDVVSRLLEAAGCDVTREYYVNDAGGQIATLGRSAYARLLQAYGENRAIPEDGYPGDYLVEVVNEHRDTLLAEIIRAAGAEKDAIGNIPDFLTGCEETAIAVCGRCAATWLLEIIKQDMGRLGVEVSNFVSETALREERVVENALEELRSKDLLYEREGAFWFRSTDFGDEKDRVVQRSNGELTYFAGDVGYHRQKLERGYDELINVWGADHHGYVKRVEAAIQALGKDPKALHVILVQLVRLTRGGEPVRMGKRTGEFVTMREVVEEVGADATRFFFLMRKADSHLDFDLDLAKKQSAENPVFYVQYVHARICSLFKQAEAERLPIPTAAEAPLEALRSKEEQELISLLARFPDVVSEATADLEPHRIVFYLIELAGAFHRFYNQHRVIGDDQDLSRARLYLVAATRKVVQTGLGLLGVRAPESM
jgi:arginyl-tRNA synthetase